MFAQAATARRYVQGGLGIGLALTKRLIELHGGRIEAYSPGLGQGSEFILRLPVGTQLPRVTRVTRPPRALPINQILLVDDMASASYVLGKLLEKMGQKVRTAQSVGEALESARKLRPDLIISDIGMPDSDGYDLARQVRQDPALKSVALVALTGYGQESDRQKTREAGFDRHLVKPVSVDALENLLTSLPQSSGKRQSRDPSANA
jgi:two-component system CheB/CheR fusion protein